MADTGTPFQVHGQVAFVTGAAGGVGRGIARVLTAAGAAPVSKDSVIEKIPVGRYCTADEVGYATLFLASRESGFITGQTLHVNGGTMMVG
jgi:3-oxoacyl-[acyl-carrier protein] reductase